MTTRIFPMAEMFGANIADGNLGAKFRFCEIEPLLSAVDQVTFDFSEVTNMTDSFANACFGVLAQTHSEELRAKVRFANCNPLIRDFIVAALAQGARRATHYA